MRGGGCYCDSFDTEVSIHINNEPDNDNHLPNDNDIGPISRVGSCVRSGPAQR